MCYNFNDTLLLLLLLLNIYNFPNVKWSSNNDKFISGLLNNCTRDVF